MAAVMQRGRVVDTFVAKDLASGTRTTLNNTRIYRALAGELERKEYKPKQENNQKRYEESRKITD